MTYKKIFKKSQPMHAKNTIIEVDINTIPGLDTIKLSNREETYEIRVVGTNLPEYVLNADPTMPTIRFITMLLQANHRFTYMGKKLNYNGWDTKTGMPLFCTIENGKRKNIRIHRTDEYKYFILKKIILTLALYLGTPTPLERAAEIYNTPKHVAWETLRWLKEPKKITINGKTMTIKHKDKNILVVHIDGTRGGNNGIIVTASGKQIKYFKGNEKNEEDLKEILADITTEGKKHNADAYMIIIDGNPKIAEFMINNLKGKAIIVEHSHSNWWEICVIYNHNKWYTIRMRNDMFTNKKRDDPKIDIPPGHIEVWEGIMHAGYARRHKRKEIIAKSVKEEMEKLLSIDITQGNPNKKAFRTCITWYVRRINQLVRAMKAYGIDISMYTDRITKTFEHAISWAKKQRHSDDYIKIIGKALSMLRGDFAHVKEELMIQIGVKHEDPCVKKELRSRRRRKASRKRRRSKLVYVGDPSHAPPHARDKIDLLRKVFDGKHITNNLPESAIGLFVDFSRTFRGRGKIMLRLMNIMAPISRVIKFIVDNICFGRGPRGSQVRFRPGDFYFVRYRDAHNHETKRIVRVEKIVGRYVHVYCYLRNDYRVLRRDRILDAYRVYPLEQS